MKSIISILLMVVTLTACTANADYTIAQKKSAIVAILSESESETETNKNGVGTGFLIKENYIVTNFHVIGDATQKLKVTTEKFEEMYEAELVYGDKDTDVAVIKLKDWDKFVKENPHMTYLEFATEMPKVTDTAWAIGHPWGLFYSISKGIISTPSRKSPDTFPMWWIQTDAHVFQGNSGGPLLNEEGKVVGMNSVMLSREGGSYGFAIPYILIQKVINDLEKYKEVRWANFGISIDDPGVTIKELSEGAAKKGGIEVGDQIISIKTEQRHLEKIETIFDLITFLSTIDYQTKVRVIVKRGESLITLDIEPGFKLSSNYAK